MAKNYDPRGRNTAKSIALVILLFVTVGLVLVASSH
jgi:hypothetical protein